MSILSLFLFWILYIAAYLINFTNIPIFEDEGEYLLLAEQITVNFPQNIFIYPQNGLLPFFGWMVAFLNTLIHDSLYAGRILNILLSSTLIFWIYKIGKLYKLSPIFSWCAMVLLTTSPILILNTRVALLDTSVLVFTAWYIYFTIKILKTPKRWDMLGLSVSLVGALLTKATAFFGLPVICWLVMSHILHGKVSFKTAFKKIGIIYFFSILILAGFLIVFGRQIESDSGSSLVTHLKVSDITLQIRQNLWKTWHWFNVYYLHFLILIPLVTIFFKKIKTKELYLIMIIWILSSVIFMIFLNRFYYPRHLLLISLPLIVICSAIVSEIPRKVGIVVLLFIVTAQSIFSWKITFHPLSSGMALEDRFSYFEDYTSGVNVPKIADKLKKVSSSKPIVVWLDGSYVFEYGLRRELKDYPNVKFESFMLGSLFLRHEPGYIVRDASRQSYIVINRWQPKNRGPLQLIESYPVSFRHSQYLYALP